MWYECLDCIIPFVIILIGFLIGRAIEHAHFKELRKWELVIKEEILITNLKTIPRDLKVEKTFLCTGCTVIAGDAFKTFIAQLKQIVGGRLGTYETLLTRARREALVRAAQEAYQHGAKVLMNVRFETSTLGKQRGGAMVEVLVYATALILAPGIKPPAYEPPSPLTPVE